MKKLKSKAKPAGNERTQRKAEFVRTVAEFMTTNQAKWSILLEMGGKDAQLWAAMRRAVPITGYPTFAEAEQALTEFLS
jgi:hypothetical protein